MKNSITLSVRLFRSVKKHLPNVLTSGNLLCGCVGIYFVTQGRSDLAVYLIWLAMIFDFLDGFVARMLHVASPIGKELDSLADMVTFGVLPSFILFELLGRYWSAPWVPFLAFSMAVFSALRLANFNIDTRQSDSFIGLPTPANALFLSSLVFLKDTMLSPLLGAWPLLVITFLFSYLLVSPLRLISLKVKNFSWADNKLRYTFVVICLLSLVCFHFAGIAVIILAYVLLSLPDRSHG